MPLISIIIPVFNKENFIEKTLRSVLSQSFSDFEIIIIDDGSTDKSALKISNFNDSRIQFYSKENGGVSTARNFGIEKANGEYIAFLDADDFWFSDYLENMVSAMKQFPEEKVFACAIQLQIRSKIFNATYSISKHKQIQKLDFFEASMDQSAISSSSVLIEKSVFKECGNFDISLKTDEDTDLWIRIGLKYPLIFSWKIGAIYNLDSQGLSKNKVFFNDKTDFTKYKNLELENLKLHKFLNLHRFSIALKSKIANNQETHKRFYKLLNMNHLSVKQRFLISLPTFLLQFLFGVKIFLEKKSIRLSAFK